MHFHCAAGGVLLLPGIVYDIHLYNYFQSNETTKKERVGKRREGQEDKRWRRGGGGRIRSGADKEDKEGEEGAEEEKLKRIVGIFDFDIGE